MTDPRVVVCGEALIDLTPDGDRYAAHPGGGPFNTARTLGRLERRLRAMQKNRHCCNRDMRQGECDDDVTPPREVDEAGCREIGNIHL